MIGVLFFILGGIIGSTIGAFIYRRDDLKSFVYGRSMCESCKSPIKFYDNIPIISYILLKGKCRNCNSKISIWIFIYEFITALVFYVLYKSYGLNVNLLIRLIEYILLLIISFTDLKFKMVYIADIFLLFFVEFVYKFLNGLSLKSSLLMCVFLGVIYLIIYLLTHAMGEADIILGAVSGFFCTDLLMAFEVFKSTFILGAIFSIIMIFLKLKDRKDEIAFCPYIAMSIFMVII